MSVICMHDNESLGEKTFTQMVLPEHSFWNKGNRNQEMAYRDLKYTAYSIKGRKSTSKLNENAPCI